MRVLKGGLIALVALVLLLVGGMHLASRTLKSEIESTLGEESSVGDISVGLLAVTINDLRIKAPPGWPDKENLYAQHIVVAPDWSALLSHKIGIRYIHADGVHQSVFRDSSAHLRVLPSLLERKQQENSAPAPEVTIGEVKLSNASVDFYDATVRKKPYRVRLEKVQVSLGQLRVPTLTGHTPVDISGVIKGTHSDGSYSLKGNVELASRDSELVTTMRDVDLTALQPYLLRSADTGVKHGELDLDIKSTVLKRQLNAHGTLVLHDLELDDEGGFMGLPRQGAVNMLKKGQRDIRMQFSMQGSLDDPKFSINESLAMRFSVGLAETLGVSIGNLGKSMGSAASGLGSALKGLLGK